MSSGKSSWADIVEEEIINGTVNGKTQTLGPNFPNSWSKVIGMPIPIEGYDLTMNDCSSSKINVKITLDDVKDEIDYWSTAVICYVLGSNPPQIVMEGYFNRIWKGKGIDKIAQVNRGVFLVRFTNVDDRENVVEEGVKMFDRKPIVVKPWKADCDVTKDKVYRIPIWIRLVGLDVKYCGKNALTKIASLNGTPLKADKATTNRVRMIYARVLVGIPLNQEYPTGVMFENKYGRIVEQKVEYEWKPVLCAKCKNFGHDIMNCRKQQREEIAKMGQGNREEK